VLTRPDGDPAKPTTVAPGRHQFGSSAQRPAPSAHQYSVVWWDPHALALGVEPSFGLRRDDLIVKDGDLFAVDERLAAYERWKSDHQAAIAAGVRPSLLVETATAWARTPRFDEHAFEIDIMSAAETGERPYGPRFGTLVHAALATAPLDADPVTVGRIVETQSRILGATAEEQRAAAHAVAAVLGHPLLDRARHAMASGRCYREAPVTWMSPDGVLIEGTIDLAFEETDGITVLDFKTDREVATDLEQYTRQLAVYCRALAAARGKNVKGVLLGV
jgi:ATP-dependent exoDNAse (exonuclease V) beta subunit